MPARKVDVKAQRQRAGQEDHSFIQLGHVDIQCITGIGLRLKVMCLTAYVAFMEFVVFSLCVGWRLSVTDIVFKIRKIYF